MGLGCLGTQFLLSHRLVVAEVTLEPAHLAVALEGQNVGGDAVEEPTIVGDDHRTTGEVLQACLEGAERIDIEVVGWLIQQQHVAAGTQQLGQVHPVAFAARELANQLLLVGAPEVEAGAVGAAVHLACAQLDGLIPVGDLLVDGAFAIEMIPVLIDVGHLHGGADSDLPRVGLRIRRGRRLFAGFDQHAKQRGFTGTVGADHADDARLRK